MWRSSRRVHRISAWVSVDPNRIFPSDDLLDHVPILLDGVADYLADPAEAVSADAAVLAKASDLARSGTHRALTPTRS